MKCRNHHGLLLASALAAASACTRSDPDVLPKEAGSRPRKCREWNAGVPAAGAVVQRATWDSVFRDEHAHATLGVVLFELTFYTTDGQTHGRRACVEALGVDPRVSIAPRIVYGLPVEPHTSAEFVLELELAFKAPARREGDKTLNAPEASHFVQFVVKGETVKQATDVPWQWNDSTLRPAWGEVKLVFEDGTPRVEPAAL